MPPKIKTSMRIIPMNKLCENALRKQIVQKSVIAVKNPKELEDKKIQLILNNIIIQKKYIDNLKF